MSCVVPPACGGVRQSIRVDEFRDGHGFPLCVSALEDAPLDHAPPELTVLRGFAIARVGQGESKIDLQLVGAASPACGRRPPRAVHSAPSFSRLARRAGVFLLFACLPSLSLLGYALRGPLALEMLREELPNQPRCARAALAFGVEFGLERFGKLDVESLHLHARPPLLQCYYVTVCGVKGCCLTPVHPFDTVRAVTEQGNGKSKRQIGPRVEESLSKEVRILAIRQGRGFNDLVEEALRDLLKKYQAKKGLLSKGKS
jgi:hypothetical protein